MKIIDKLLAVAIFFLAPMLGVQSFHPSDQIDNIENYLTFLIFFATAFLYQELLLRYIKTKDDKKKKNDYPKVKNALFILLILLLSFFLLGMIHQTRYMFDESFLFLALGAVACTSLRNIGWRKESSATQIALTMIPTSIIGYLSFVVLTGRWDWQPALLTCGFGIHLSSRTALSHMIRNIKSDLKIEDYLEKTHALLLLGGPMLMTSLSILRQLPKNYIFLLVPLLLTPRILTDIKKGIELKNINKNKALTILLRTHSQNTAISVGILLIVALLSSFS